MKFLLLFSFILITLGSFAQTTSTTLQATGSDVDGTVTSFTWSQISGPTNSAIVTPTSSTGKTVVNNLTVGVYKFQVVAIDNDGLSSIPATMQVTVKGQKQAPHVDAGPDQIIQIPGVTGIILKNEILNSTALVQRDYVIPENGHYLVKVSKDR